MADVGGDDPCWAGAISADGLGGRALIAHDVDESAGSGGVVWHLPPGLDLNANLVRLDPDTRMPAHRNDEVDVLVIVRDGGGEVIVDGIRHVLAASTIALIPRGTDREIAAGSDGLAYLTVHRQRGGPTIG